MACPTVSLRFSISLKVKTILTDCIGFRQEESIKDLQRDCFLKLAIYRPNLGCRSSDSALSRAARFGKAAMA